MASAADGSAVHGPDEHPSADPTLPLDAVANLRLLGEVQRRGLEAANQVIARLTERTNASGDGASPPGATDPMAAMTDAFVESLSTAMAAMVPGAGPQARSSSGAAGDGGSPEVLVAAGEPGEQIDVELWLHNYTDDLATGIEFHAGELLSATGGRLSSGCVTTLPDHTFDLSAASSRSVHLVIDLPHDTALGRYRGVVSASHLADLWLVLEVVVGATGGDPAS